MKTYIAIIGAVLLGIVGVAWAAEWTMLVDPNSHDCKATADADCHQYVASDVVEIGGSAVNVNGGNRDAGTQTITLADDDPAVTDLAAMEVLLDVIDDWDAVHDSSVSTDGAQVMLSARSSQESAVANGDAVRAVANIYGELVLAGYTWATSSTRTEEIDPISAHHDESTLCELTNIATNTTDYCGYIDMDGYRTLTVHCVASGTPTDTITMTVECSLQDDGTASASCDYLDVTTSFKELGDNDHNANYTDEEVILSNYFPAGFKYCRVEYVTSNGGGDDQDLTCFVKKLY